MRALRLLNKSVRRPVACPLSSGVSYSSSSFVSLQTSALPLPFPSGCSPTVASSTFAAACRSAILCRPFSSSSADAATETSSSASAPSSSSSSTVPKGELILVDKKDGIAIVTLNRPKALNALCDQLIRELNAALQFLDKDNDVGAIVITGNQKAFAAGADIKEMASKSGVEAFQSNMLAFWHDVTQIRKPLIAAVNGYALGGGCELAMMCDIIIAGDNAHFGQPEIKLGTIPGCGGTQRLTRAVGKSKAMEIILTGKNIDAEEAERIGLISRVVPHAELLTFAKEMAVQIAAYSRPIVAAAKEAVNTAYETTLTQGVLFERRLFHATFSTKDQKEGMAAFAAKRKPSFKHE